MWHIQSIMDIAYLYKDMCLQTNKRESLNNLCLAELFQSCCAAFSNTFILQGLIIENAELDERVDSHTSCENDSLPSSSTVLLSSSTAGRRSSFLKVAEVDSHTLCENDRILSSSCWKDGKCHPELDSGSIHLTKASVDRITPPVLRTSSPSREDSKERQVCYA